ncbi:tellurite resistance protein TehA-like permease [Nocardioides ginsengisegetis]|uniref:Tellurite resistance protein TehA-like permease n=1 Tax=Nocardioides ginsengisegetis TaxID=661491 RepID=A0A7W3J187_9ACTN|nr:C4-dicarboxylate ABC transporter [Nocardioides ginsengisegetis]MBA8804397.1 tellurite resistance protein TehA-like permease [Nocardioides ginsengisegetis]
MTTLLAVRPLAPGRSSVLDSFGPNWFATVMGTGIVATAGATLPFVAPGLADLTAAVWALDALVLLVVGGATVRHWLRRPDVARAHAYDPAMAHFYGAPAMALMTVGAGAVLAGEPLVGTHAAVALDALLWTAGSVLGLATTVLVPRAARARGDYRLEAASATWLMPVVPPMVSAATGPLLLSHLPDGPARRALGAACVAMFALALLASMPVVAALLKRLARHGRGPAATVPTLWIVLGPLGQSVTAAHALSASGAMPPSFGLRYGLPTLLLAGAWATFAAAATVRAARDGLPFTMAWWSFTFPVGTVVTGTSALAAATGAQALAVASGVLYLALLAAWATVATRTLGSLRT